MLDADATISTPNGPSYRGGSNGPARAVVVEIPAPGRCAAAGGLRGLTRRWSLRAAESDAMSEEPLASRVLRFRGVDDLSAPAFLDPKLTDLHDPSLIPDMDKAARRLLDAARAREPIVIYGDYDADGITASAILFAILTALAPQARVTTYVPHRLEEGYGLNTQAIETLASEGARVIVSVDCGVTAVAPALAARRAGVDLIITDHHNPPSRMEDLPAAFAVVHPRRPDSRYPFGDLCGAGVAFKLAWRLATMESGGQRASPQVRGLLVELLAFAALGSIADVVPLVGENRIIARFGLARIKHSPLEGLRALVEAAGLSGEKVDAADVGFKLAPRLNACGRMAHAREAVELFTLARGARAAEIARDLTQLNNDRRAVEREIFAQACEKAEAAGMTGDDRRAIVLADPRWHAGVVGIVCSRLVERYGRPAILMAQRDGHAHGSGRSIDGFNLHGALERCAELLTKFGGHDMAAGLQVADERLEAFADRFIAAAGEAITVEQLTPSLTVDVSASLAQLSVGCVRALEALEPFGRGNPPVNVMIPGAAIDGPPTPLGTAGQHLALNVRQGERIMRVVAWNWGARREQLVRGARVNLVVRPAISTWSGRVSVEPELIDLGPA